MRSGRAREAHGRNCAVASGGAEGGRRKDRRPRGMGAARREAGKTELLDALLKEFADSFDRPGMEAERPYKCDFHAIRDKALQAFTK